MKAKSVAAVVKLTDISNIDPPMTEDFKLLGLKPVSIIIPTLNEELYLPALLDSLKKISAPLDIIVVDGNSEDNPVQVVEGYQSHFIGDSSLRLIRSSKRGIAYQRNLGAAHARHPILIFCDADIIIPSHEAHIEFVSRFISGGYVAVGARLVPIEKGIHLRVHLTFAYLVQHFLLVLGKPYLAGGCLITTSDVFSKVGGFDENVVLGEDVDYSLRVSRIGRCTVFNIPYPVSARRIIKYGYGWMISEIPNLLRFLFTGKVSPETIFYPFGEYGGQTAHHVTSNRGTSK
jgi:glycosyltransferase involved in cell wall biosynthesis